MDEQQLRRFVLNAKALCYEVGNITVPNHIEVESPDFIRGPVPFAFEAVLGYGADGTAGTVFEDDAGKLMGKLDDLVNLLGSCKWCPFHAKRMCCKMQNPGT
jgi:hypothetical protein